MSPELVYVLSQDSSSPFYKSYASLFKAYLPTSIEIQVVEDLDVIGHLLFQMMMHIDRIEDDQAKGMDTVIALQTEAAKRLSYYFPIDHSFWIQYDRIVKEFSKRKRLDRLCHQRSSWANYESLALSRSIYAELGLIALLELGLIENQKCDTLLKSHKQFVIAFQLYDDCADFYEDQSKEQFNWAIHMASNKGIPLDQFYQSTLFTALIDTVVNYLDRAAELVKELPKSKYSRLLQKIRDSVDSLYQV
jgi:hypothetical protein